MSGCLGVWGVPDPHVTRELVIDHPMDQIFHLPLP
jgi:hypothetical protein